MKENKFNLIATIENPTTHEIKTIIKDCYFDKDFDGLDIDDTYYTLEYDPNYETGREISYLALWADNHWTGENGSWKLIGVQIQSIVEEGGE